jgi:hypothetical protein
MLSGDESGLAKLEAERTILCGARHAHLAEGLCSDGLTTTEREELKRLRCENRVLREEREILSKAAAWFAQETGATPSRRSHSWQPTRPCIGLRECAACWASPPAAIRRGLSARLRRALAWTPS